MILSLTSMVETLSMVLPAGVPEKFVFYANSFLLLTAPTASQIWVTALLVTLNARWSSKPKDGQDPSTPHGSHFFWCGSILLVDFLKMFRQIFLIFCFDFTI